MEVSKSTTREGVDEWFITQESYIKDLLAHNEDRKIHPRKIPITRAQSQAEKAEDGKTPESIRLAQKQVGEVLWVVTRTRPELMYATAIMGSLTLKSPTVVAEIYDQILGYLQSTPRDGLVFRRKDLDPAVLDFFADASFAPQGGVSHGAFVIQLNGNPILWRSGKQSLVTQSTAESEMLEVIEAMLGGESIYVMAQEIFDVVLRRIWSDSQAAVAILTQEGGSWRTRHLRLRAAAARQVLQDGTWTIQHQKGEDMIADLGTKPLTGTRIQYLKELLGMKASKNQEDEKPEEKTEEEPRKKEEEKKKEEEELKLRQATKIMKVVVLAALVSAAESKVERDEKEDINLDYFAIGLIIMIILAVARHPTWKFLKGAAVWLFISSKAPKAKAQGEEEKEEQSVELWVMMILYTLLVIGTTLMLQRLFLGGVGPFWTSRSEGSNEDRRLRGEEVQEDETGEKEDEGGSGTRSLVRLSSDDEQEEGRDGHSQLLPAGSDQDLDQTDRSFVSSIQGELDESLTTEPLDRQGSPDDVNLGEMIMRELEQIEREEREIWHDLNRTPLTFEERAADAPLPRRNSAGEELEDEGFPFPFFAMKTRNGRVYHTDRNCTHLHAPRVSQAFDHQWCSVCRHVALQTRGVPPPGVNLFIAPARRCAHTDTRCPYLQNAVETRICITCLATERTDENERQFEP